jgi:hypothetical protein
LKLAQKEDDSLFASAKAIEILVLEDRQKGAIFSSGTDVMIFKIFSPKKSAKKLAFLSQNKAKF